ncbi:unnamed protein product [Brassicogethes aeneus]|uniref:Glucose dehydrogenase n=1 Tax=Brassicogethes aeneus TaxID=1431903 RepID=A0A9P0BI36_BRAAE|nr:unnamed protein product [Brassicogethes aeneus]
MLQGTAYDWKYTTVPQKWGAYGLAGNVSQLLLSLNYCDYFCNVKRSKWPMGKLVGGTAQFNNLMYLRGHPDDFKEWYKDLPSFDYKRDILPYYKKLESTGDSFLSRLPFTSSAAEYALNAFKSLGYNVNKNQLDSFVGFGSPYVNIKNGKRWTSFHQLLSHDRPNVFLLSHTTALEVLFRSNYEAYGVKYIRSGETVVSLARHGVILSAGVIGSPKLLMMSGVGVKSHLQSVNIETKLDLPVGDNLQDHITTGFSLVTFNDTLDFGVGISTMLNPLTALEYFRTQSGPWTTVGCEVNGFINTKNPKNPLAQPDLQLMMLPLGIEEDSGLYLRKLMGISDATWYNYFHHVNKSIAVLPVLLHPKSRGTVRLESKNIDKQPLIDPNYLSVEDDVETLYEGIQIVKKFVDAEPMRNLGAELNALPLPGCEHLTFDSEPYWFCYLRHMTYTAYHPVGTCKMGADDASVVGYDFKVRGTNRLYVVDASVFPTLTSGNVNAAVLMMAEKAADVILEQLFLKTGFCCILEIFKMKTVCEI